MVISSDDCDDTTAATHPEASEICDEAENDCDGSVDEEVLSTWYMDFDGDGFGTDVLTVEACAATDGFGESDTEFVCDG